MSWWEPVPRAYRTKPRRPLTVTAFPYDGTPTAQATIRRWLTSRPTGSVTMRVDRSATPEPTLVIEQSAGEPVHLLPGEVLVLRGSRFQRCASTDFDAEFKPAPREMPIYDGGE